MHEIIKMSRLRGGWCDNDANDVSNKCFFLLSVIASHIITLPERQLMRKTMWPQLWVIVYSADCAEVFFFIFYLFLNSSQLSFFHARLVLSSAILSHVEHSSLTTHSALTFFSHRWLAHFQVVEKDLLTIQQTFNYAFDKFQRKIVIFSLFFPLPRVNYYDKIFYCIVDDVALHALLILSVNIIPSLSSLSTFRFSFW